MEPSAVAAHRQRRFKRKHYWCAGVNDIWCQDQHDKWLRFRLFFHNSVDPFMSYNNWLKVWWTNKNPKLITRYYFEAVCKLGGMMFITILHAQSHNPFKGVPLITQSDPGTKNFGVANAHTMI
jgi:hypothetical protein